MKQIITIIALIFSFHLSSQPLSGNYTIGTNGDFTSINQAIDSLTTKGISGPVVMNILPGTYNGPITIGNINGTSANNTVTFQSANGDSTSVVLTFTTYPSAYYLMSISSDYININKLSFYLMCSFGNAGTTLGINSDYCKITNCIFTGGSSNYYILIHITGADLNNTIIKNNIIKGLYKYGIRLSSNWNSGYNNVIENNILTGNYYNTEQGLYLVRQKSAIEKNNILKNNNDVRIYDCSANTIFSNNNIDGNFKIVNCNGSSTDHTLISNNFFLLKKNWYKPSVNIEDCSYIYFYNNSLSDSGSINTYAFQIKNSSNCTIKNNIFYDRAYGVLYYYDQGNTNIISDHNDFYTNGYYGKTYNSSTPAISLTAWKTMSGKEANSININPSFYSDSDLHLGNAAMDGTGVSLVQVTNDIDGEPRPAIPDMGADESNFSLIDAGVVSLEYNTYLPDSICGYDIIDSIKIIVKNRGINTINFSTDSMLINLTLSGPINSTFQKYISTDSLLKDSIREYLITPTVNMSIGGTYSISATISIAADSNALNDQSTVYSATNYKIETLPYLQDFENFTDGLSGNYIENDFKEGWGKSANYSHNWTHYTTFKVKKGAFYTNSMGPAYDHTTLSTNGKWIYSDHYIDDTVTMKMWTPCINFTNIQHPVLSFWYHLHGQYLTYDTLYIDVFNGSSWDLGIYSIGGQHQSAAGAPWQQATVDLSTYTNMQVTIRFRVEHRNQHYAIMAIDDVALDAMPDVALGNDTAICNGDTLLLGFPQKVGYTYQWKEMSSGLQVGQGSYYNASQSGIYVFKATNSMGIFASDTIVLTINPLPTPDLGPDTTICNNTSIMLSTTNSYLSFLWQDSSTAPIFIVDSTSGSGNYWVRVENSNHCFGRDTVTITLDTCAGFVNHFSDKLSLIIYPNPSHNCFYIKSNNFNGKVKMRLFDSQGRQIIYKLLYISKNTQLKINTVNLVKGIYYLHIENNSEVFTGKIIVN